MQCQVQDYQLGKCGNLSLKWEAFVYVSTWKTTRRELIPADISAANRGGVKSRGRKIAGKELKSPNLQVCVSVCLLLLEDWRVFLFFFFQGRVSISVFFCAFEADKSRLFLSLYNPPGCRHDARATSALRNGGASECQGKHTGHQC